MPGYVTNNGNPVVNNGNAVTYTLGALPGAPWEKWILNRLNYAVGTIEVTVLRGRTDYDLSEGISWGTFRMDNSCHFLLEGGLEKVTELSGDDGSIKAQQMEFLVQDRFYAHGQVDDGSGTFSESQVFDFASIGMTAAQYLFSDKDINYTVVVHCHTHYNAQPECIFVGELDGRTINWDKGFIDKGQTIAELVLHEVKFTVSSLIERLSKKTVQDFIDYDGGITVDSMAGDSDAQNFYAGFVGQEDLREEIDYYLAQFYSNTNGIDWDNIILTRGDWDSYTTLLAYRNVYDLGHYPTDEFPKGSWGISLDTILARIAETCGCATYSDITDFIPAFTPWGGEWNDGGGIDPVQITPGNVCVNYNTVFGVSPEDGSEWQNPIAFARNTPLKDVIKKFAVDWGCHIWVEYDNATAKPRFRILARDTNWGALPDEWKTGRGVLSTKEEPKVLGKASVTLKNKASEGGVRMFTGKTGETLDMEIFLRARAWGNSTNYNGGGDPVFRTRHMVVNSKWDLWEQLKAAKRFSPDQENRLNEDGWILGSYYYYYNSTIDPASAPIPYPPGASDSIYTANPGGLNNDARGYYTIQHISEKSELETGNLLRRDNSLYAPGVFYRREFFGTRANIVREYAGVQNTSTIAIFANKTIGAVQPGLRDTWRYGGVLTTFRATSIRQRFKANTSEVKWEQVTSFDESMSGGYEFFDGASGTTGGSGSATGGGNTNVIYLPPPTDTGVARRLVCDYVTPKQAWLKLDYGRRTLQLVLDDANEVHNGLWIVQADGTVNRDARPLPYGQEFICKQSHSNFYGTDSVWQVYGNLLPYGNILTRYLIPGTDELWFIRKGVDRRIQRYSQNLINLWFDGAHFESSDGFLSVNATVPDNEDDTIIGERIVRWDFTRGSAHCAVVEYATSEYDSPVAVPFNSPGARGWSSALPIATNIFCDGIDSGHVSNTNPFVLSPTIEGLWHVHARLQVDTVPTTLGTTQCEIGLAHTVASIPTMHVVDSRYIHSTVTEDTIIFLEGEQQFNMGSGDAVQLFFRHYALTGVVPLPAFISIRAKYLGPESCAGLPCT